MSSLSRFMKKNKRVKENAKYIATQSLTDENGKPLEWELRPLTTRKNSQIREECTIEIQIPGKVGLYRPKVNNNKYLAKLIVESVVFPDLYDKELQDSYGVMTPEELIMEMIDNAGEYNNLVKFIQDYNEFDVSINDKVKEAKN